MKRTALVVLAGGCLLAAIADKGPPELKTLQVLRAKKVKEVDDAYVQALEKMMVKYTRRGDLESANAVHAELKQMRESDPAAAEEGGIGEAPVTEVVLLHTDAVFRGSSLKLHKTLPCIAFWISGEEIRFNIPNLEKGTYRVKIKYAAAKGFDAKLRIKLNGESHRERFESTKTWKNATDKQIEPFEHDGGEVDVELSLMETTHSKYGINIFSVTFARI